MPLSLYGHLFLSDAWHWSEQAKPSRYWLPTVFLTTPICWSSAWDYNYGKGNTACWKCYACFNVVLSVMLFTHICLIFTYLICQYSVYRLQHQRFKIKYLLSSIISQLLILKLKQKNSLKFLKNSTIPGLHNIWLWKG